MDSRNANLNPKVGPKTSKSRHFRGFYVPIRANLDSSDTRTYNGAAELTSLVSSFSDANHPPTLFSVPAGGYNAPGMLTSATLGNGIAENRRYNPRLEMTSTSAGSVYSLSLGYAPNGDVTSAADSVNGTWTYANDDFNRLLGSSCSLHCPDGQNTQGFSYSYDRFGNRWDQNVTAGSGGTIDLTFTGNNNHIDGDSYDAAGNLMSDGSHTYFYDAEHHLVQVDGSEGWCQSNAGTAATACYTYDADGRRVRRSVPGDGITDDFLYDLGGHFITQVSGSGTWVRGEIYANGEHLATYENDLSTPTTFFTHTDHLGTERVQTAVSGSSCETITNLPFGDGLNTSGSCDPTSLRFTGKQRDFETNLDNFGPRYNSSQLGRFMSPDPLGLNAANPADPQSLNLYSFVRNSPLSFTDPTGLDCVYFNDAGDAAEWIDHNSNNTECNQHGGDWVNGTTSLNQVSYNNANDTFRINSSDSNYNYSVTANAPGPQTAANGNCYGNCISTYSQSPVIPSPLWAGFTSFFSVRQMAKTTYYSFADANGCDRLMASTFGSDLSPFPSGGPGASDVTNPDNLRGLAYGAGLARASGYSFNRGLVQPWKSGTFRRFMGQAAEGADAAAEVALPLAFAYATADSVGGAIYAAATGTCH